MSTQMTNSAEQQAGVPVRSGYVTSTKRVPTRRGVMWLGQTCNLRCYFCYFLNRIENAEHPEHPFMELDKAKEICTTLRRVYGNTAIDIQGGEPTIYPDIFELITHCKDLGLHPTLITNGIILGKEGVLEKFKEAGVRDFLVSLHGLGEVHDEVVGRRGAAEKIIAAIERMVEIGVPFRFNCTMSKPVVPHLVDIARKAVAYGANAVNYIAFNPFGDQESGTRTHDNVPKYSEITPRLTEALDILEEAGIEANVRYLPLCMAETRHRKNFYNFQQLTYDHHEWDYESWIWTMMQPQMMKEDGLAPPPKLGPGASRLYRVWPHASRNAYAKYPRTVSVLLKAQHVAAKMEQTLRGRRAMLRKEARHRAAYDCQYKYHESCTRCALQEICDGFHGDYAEFFGTSEAVPVTDVSTINDPTHFISAQEKIVEEEDRAWSL